MAAFSKSIAVFHPQLASFSLGARRAWAVLTGSYFALEHTRVKFGRRMALAGAFPLYLCPRLDISKEVLALLNVEKDGEHQ
jgi:hypothetical protein